MALLKRVVITEEKVCSKCKKQIGIGSIGVKDRRSKYKITSKSEDKEKKIERFYEKPTEYYHVDCLNKGVKV